MTLEVFAQRVIARGSLALALVVTLAAGCGDDDPTDIEWSASSFPVTAHFGDPCLSHAGVAVGAEIEAAPWAVGTALAVQWGWIRPCGGWFGEACSPLEEERVALTSTDAWRPLDPAPPLGPRALVLEAVAPGTGTLGARANGHDFDPLELHAVAPAVLVARAGWGDDGTGTPVDVTVLTLAPGAHEVVVATLRDAGATDLCGSVLLDVAIDAPLVTIEVIGAGEVGRTVTPRTSFPLVVTAGSSPGTAHATLTAGDHSTTLEVRVVAP